MNHTFFTKQVCIFTLSIAMGLACTPKNTISQSENSTETTNQDTKMPTASVTNMDAETYSVNLPKSGQVLTIIPKPGYKVNADFPHRAHYIASETKEVALTQHNEKELSFKASETTKLPQSGIKAETSFSICNDQMCKMYKETYTW